MLLAAGFHLDPPRQLKRFRRPLAAAKGEKTGNREGRWGKGKRRKGEGDKEQKRAGKGKYKGD